MYSSRQIFITAVASLLIAGSILVSFLLYLNRELNLVAGQAAALAVLHADTSRQLEILNHARTITAGGEILSRYFVNANNVADFIEAVEELAKAAGVELTVNQAIAREQLFLDAYTEGTWAAAVGFVRLLESMPFYVSIANLSLTQLDQNKWSARLSLTLISFEL